MTLLLASAVFLVSTHLPLGHEIKDMRAQLEVVGARATAAAPATLNEPGTVFLGSLPRRADMPALLGTLLRQADAAHLSIDTGKYATTPLKNGGVMSYQISFPVTGPYPQVRRFIDSTLTALPAVAMSELSLTRKTVGDGEVEARIRLTVFTRDNP
jgi:Tfp pilus assembly protein PilO